MICLICASFAKSLSTQNLEITTDVKLGRYHLTVAQRAS